MVFFADAAEVDRYIGGMFRSAGDHPGVGVRMKAAGIVLRIEYAEPDCVMTVVFRDPMEIIVGEPAPSPDVTLMMRADTADRFWRGEYNLPVGIAKGQVKANGPVNKILKLVPLTKPLFPSYRELVAAKDGSAA